MDPIENALKKKLEAQISQIDAKILALTSERRTVQRMLASLVQIEVQPSEPVRKNAAQRVIVEKVILDFLAFGPASSEQIFQYVRIVHRAINPTTFRSYLHRLDRRGLISRGASRGQWRLPAH